MLGCGALRFGFRVWGFMNIEFGGFGVHDPGLRKDQQRFVENSKGCMFRNPHHLNSQSTYIESKPFSRPYTAP